MVAEALSDQSDTQLVEQFLARHDPAVFEALVRRHGPMVYRVCRRVLRHHQDAEDAFQAAFLLLVQKLRTVRKHASLASWLHGVAYRVALKARAAAATRRRHEQQAPIGQDMPLEDVAWKELRAVLDSELTKLPERWRLPLVLCYLEGQTQDEAATQLGWSTRTLRRRLEEGRTALARRLRRRGVLWPAALGVVLLSDCAAPAAPWPALVDGTVAAAARIAAGQAAATVLAPEVAALAKGVARSMWFTKFRIAAVVLLLGVLAGCALGVLTRTTTVAGPSAAAGTAQPKVAPTWKERITIHYDDALYVFSVALSPDGKTLATGINHFDRSRSGEVALWDTGTGKMHTVLKGHTELVQSLAFSPDGKSLASASHDRTVKVWDVAACKEARSWTVTDVPGCAMSVAFSPDGKTLAVGWAKGPGEEGVQLMDVASGKKLADVAGFRAAFSPDGKTVATGTTDGLLKFLDAATGKEGTAVQAHGGPVTFLAFAPDGRTLATVSNADDTVRLWEVATGKQRAALAQATFAVNSLAFSPDGKSLAVGSHARDGAKVSGMVILWDPATGKRHGTLLVENGPVTAVAFASNSGTTLAAASYSALPGGDITNFSKGITRVALKIWDFR
jgi:RNA polymerase sigma factor (sigma-70 family)